MTRVLLRFRPLSVDLSHDMGEFEVCLAHLCLRNQGHTSQRVPLKRKNRHSLSASLIVPGQDDASQHIYAPNIKVERIKRCTAWWLAESDGK